MESYAAFVDRFFSSHAPGRPSARIGAVQRNISKQALKLALKQDAYFGATRTMLGFGGAFMP